MDATKIILSQANRIAELEQENQALRQDRDKWKAEAEHRMPTYPLGEEETFLALAHAFNIPPEVLRGRRGKS